MLEQIANAVHPAQSNEPSGKGNFGSSCCKKITPPTGALTEKRQTLGWRENRLNKRGIVHAVNPAGVCLAPEPPRCGKPGRVVVPAAA